MLILPEIMEFSMLKSKYIVMVYCIIAMYTNKHSNLVDAVSVSDLSVVVDGIKSYDVNIDPKKISSNWTKSTYILTGVGVNDGAEVIRILLNKLHVTFVYRQLNDNQLKSLNAEVRVGRAPFLEIDKKVLFGQPIATSRYLANLAGLNGENDRDKAVIDTYIELIMDWHIKVFTFHYDTDKTYREKKRSELMETTLPEYLRKFEDILVDNGTGYIFGDKLSWVDLAFVNTLNFVKIATNYEENLKKYKSSLELIQKVSEFVRVLDEQALKKDIKEVVLDDVNVFYERR